MRTPPFLAPVIIVAILCSALPAENAPPQRQLNTFPLHGNPSSADFSPDEKYVVTLISRSQPTDDSSKVKNTDLVQLWDFRSDKLVSENTLHEEVQEKGKPPGYLERRRYVRYSADGQLVLVYVDRCVYVLKANDLQLARRIQLNGPPDVSRTFTTKSGTHTVADKAGVVAFEVSTVGQFGALVWQRGFSDAWVQLVDSDGLKQYVWNTKDRGLGYMPPRAIAWSADGQQLVLAVPDGFACGHHGSGPDIFGVDPFSGEIKARVATGLLVGDIAVTLDGRVLAVDTDCVGVFANHDPPLKIYELRTGKKLKELSGRGTGVRYAVTASRKRVAAYTGIVKAGFDWGDMVPFDRYIDWTFSVWDLSTYQGVVTSQKLNHGVPHHGFNSFEGQVPLRMSPNGGFVMQGTSIYELP